MSEKLQIHPLSGKGALMTQEEKKICSFKMAREPGEKNPIYEVGRIYRTGELGSSREVP